MKLKQSQTRQAILNDIGKILKEFCENICGATILNTEVYLSHFSIFLIVISFLFSDKPYAASWITLTFPQLLFLFPVSSILNCYTILFTRVLFNVFSFCLSHHIVFIHIKLFLNNFSDGLNFFIISFFLVNLLNKNSSNIHTRP